MSNYKAKMKLLADTIRSKCNISNKLTIENMISVIDNISTETGTDAYVVVDDNGVLKAQKLSFNGTEASFDGTAETLDTTKVGLFSTTQDEPTYTGSGSGGAFYKCASVDTTAKTWNGYKAVLTDGVYTFEETVTEGLTYTSVTPAVGRIYTEGALATVSTLYTGVPTEGLVLYVPLADASPTAETGQELISTNVLYATYKGIDCCIFNNASITFDSSALPKGDSDRTVSLWAYITDSLTRNTLFSYGGSGDNNGYVMEYRNNKLSVAGHGGSHNEFYGNTTLSTETWYHFVLVHKSGADYFYINGSNDGSASCTRATSGSSGMIGGEFASSDRMKGYLAGVRVFNRALDEGEIAALASEFTPTA